jgi:hypothetical protein
MRDLRLAVFALFLAVVPASAQQAAPETSSQQGVNTVNSSNVVVTDLASGGLTVMSPENPDFDVTARKLFSGPTADAVLSLKPLLVILSNRADRTVVAFAVEWKVSYRNGRTNSTMTQFKYSDAIAGNPDTGGVPLEKRDDRPLPAGQERLVAKDVELGPGWEEPFYRDQLVSFAADQKRNLAEADKIEITLDAAIFSDGQLVGPDHSNVDQAFMTTFEAKQELFRQIVADLDAGHTMDEAFARVTSAAQQRPTPGCDLTGLYRRTAATEVIALRKRVGDDAVKTTFQGAIRKEPFSIKRAQ